MDKNMNRKKKVLIVFLVLVALLSIYILISLWVSTYWITVREFTVEFDENAPEIRAVVISDLHDHEFGEDNDRLVEKIKAEKPDIILMDGDILNSGSDNADVPLTLIRSLVDTAPVYYALGNHEISYMDGGHPELIEELEESGAVVLDRNYVDLEINGRQIRLGGLYDYAFGLNGDNDALAAPQDIQIFLEQFENTERLKIMLSHRPDSFIFGDADEVWDVDLVISGHDHGGQVVIPFLGGMFGGDQGLFPKYVHGLYEKGNFQLFVTSGLGSDKQKLPRFNNPPEVAVLTIR